MVLAALCTRFHLSMFAKVGMVWLFLVCAIAASSVHGVQL